ncbi:tyrosine kinase receptor Cad96Ca-like protein [Leptotrombidium deliense]|uniref:receptor protein-tyrosine kinase n=1 Tax=Leptotrombidium deliense TaxID=299467 RepID=A0A443SNX0_9ACAR|nr:tyrosine kinase receptor Cad96Ca-like protein [Leptotrombidium deliense]
MIRQKDTLCHQQLYDISKTKEQISTKNTSSTQIYIIVVIGVVPAALGAIFYWFTKWKKRRSKRPQHRYSPSTMIAVNAPNYTEIREFRYNYNDLQSVHKSQNIHNNIPRNTCDSLFVRKRRVYSIEFPRKNLELQTVLGEGNFGLVWKAKVEGINGSATVAVKTVKPESNENEWSDLLKELNIMLQLGEHPNVVRLLGCCTETVPYYLIIEFVENGKLLSFLRDYRKPKEYYNESDVYLTTSDLLSFAHSCAKGMEFISSYGIIHRDIAARNILVDKNKNCKVADFGLARCIRDKDDDVYEQKTKGAMPVRWMAPESLTVSVFTTKSDVWSFGILLWEIVTLGSTPYPGLGANEVIKNVSEGFIMENPNVIWCSNACYNLMKDCWHNNPKKRPTFSDVKQRIYDLMEKRKEYIEFTNFADNMYYKILYTSQGEKV